ncbi:MAG: TIGR03936 family radical SAM-associated protein [Clostridia bacterium]
MFDYHLIYEKTDNAKYISHLDFVRTYNRTMRRAKLPVAFSEGFNPHPLLGFALPLSVGYTSECELLEFRLTEELEENEIKERLNAVIPMGIKILSVHKGKSRMKKLRYALYLVYPERLPDSVDGFMSLSEIVIDKKTKSGVKDTDIRRDIVEIRLLPDHMEMVLSAGSDKNLKPDVVVKAMNKYIEGYDSGDCEYHRKAIYDGDMTEIN